VARTGSFVRRIHERGKMGGCLAHAFSALDDDAPIPEARLVYSFSHLGPVCVAGSNREMIQQYHSQSPRNREVRINGVGRQEVHEVFLELILRGDFND
jgi:hypothetical protein